MATHLNLSSGKTSFPAGSMHFLTGQYSSHAANRRQNLTDSGWPAGDAPRALPLCAPVISNVMWNSR